MLDKEDLRTIRWDVTELLRTQEEVAAYLEAAIEEGADDKECMTGVLADIARAKGMSVIAQELGIPRASLYPVIGREAVSEAELIGRLLKLYSTAAAAEKAVP